MAGPHLSVHRRRLISALLLSTLVASSLLTVARAPERAGADQIDSLKARATAVSQQLVEEQLEVGAYQQQYSVATARTATEAQAIAQIGQQIAEDQRQIGTRTDLVRADAIRSYTDYGTSTSGADGGLFGGNQETAQAASEYTSIAVGNITTAVDQLRTAQQALQTHQATLRQQQRQDQLDQSREASDLGHADTTEQQLSSLDSQVTGQLAAAVAQQAATQAQAAAAAVAAAQRAATRTPVTRNGSAPSPTVAAVSTQATSASPAPTSASAPDPVVPTTTTADPALNSFLQCVVQAESGGNYGAVSPDGLYMGAFQFSQATWNTAARAAGLADLVGVPPNLASKADQDAVAVALYALDGEQPWLGDRCSA
jgi:peptidoglycan hydrolase CwlO-like protein